MFAGLGQHRLQVAPSSDSLADGSPYAVYLNFAAGLEVRPGFARLGADAYFAADGSVTHIVRGGETHKPGDAGWASTKMAFRGTLNGVTTALDHLYAVHLVVGNAIVTANVEEVEPDHMLRRLFTPFGYRTEAINFQASFALTNEMGLVHRGYPLSKAGLEALWEYAGSADAHTWQSIPERHEATGLQQTGLLIPLHQDGGEYYEIIHSYVAAYLSMNGAGPTDNCTADPQIVRWWNRVNSIAPAHDLPPLTCDNLAVVVSTSMYYVSAGHNHVGTTAEEIEDPCFMPWAWYDHTHEDFAGSEPATCGLPRTNLVQQIAMCATGLEQPKILQDYTHMWDDQAEKDLWLHLIAELGSFGEVVKQRNSDGSRPRPYRVFETEIIETSVGI